MHILQSSGCFYFSCPRHGGRDREEIKERRGPGINFLCNGISSDPVHKHGGKRRRRGNRRRESGGAVGIPSVNPSLPDVIRYIGRMMMPVGE